MQYNLNLNGTCLRFDLLMQVAVKTSEREIDLLTIRMTKGYESKGEYVGFRRFRRCLWKNNNTLIASSGMWLNIACRPISVSSATHLHRKAG